MEIPELKNIYSQQTALLSLSEAIMKGSDVSVSGLSGSATAMTIAALYPTTHSMMLVVANDDEQAAYLHQDIIANIHQDKKKDVLLLPSSIRRHGSRDAGNDVTRTEVMLQISDTDKIQKDRHLCLVSTVEALAEHVVSASAMASARLSVKVGDHMAVSTLDDKLNEMGFRRTDYVYEPGEYAIRGSIVDVYSYAYDNPIRLDFFGDEIDSLRTFDIGTQLSINRHQEIIITTLASCDQAEEGSVAVTKLLPTDTLVVIATQLISPDEDTTKQEVLTDLQQWQTLWAVNNTTAQNDHTQTQNIKKKKQTEIAFDTIPQPLTHKNFALTEKIFSQYINDGYTLYILSENQKQAERLKTVFDTDYQSKNTDKAITFIPVKGVLHEGFADCSLKACFFTDHQIFDRFHRHVISGENARRGKIALSLKELQQFEIGDYVVHIDHGVGRFGGLVRLPQDDGTTREMIKISYAREDTVYVSIHALHKVSKYKGRDGEPPRLSSLGTGAWENMKERTKSRLKDIARDLIKLYSDRSRQRGFAFSPDSFLQHELEASFLYEDTPDQLKATEDVKRDMESARPMDRLICGDVGFGKTEIAVRAALKAAVDNKQTAVMVPTTLLAYQHYNTFCKRLKNMPVRIEYLSRARTAAQTKEILDSLADGRVNIVIGTHKLLGKQVKFKDLGLLIIDEEQKFGVATKEKLRQIRTNVDTLTLTATPIPRTLQFSLMGARDLSVIQTPPPNRYPIQTEVHTFDADIIADAVNFEMSRHGQVYIVNHRISGLYEIENIVRQKVPDARIAVGHGQMSPTELEEIMVAFASYEYDVLISTTIIESGIDIPNANTIIINGAHHFGLSDLHQMRGRVGRSNKRAFCYLLSPPLSALRDDARRRLQAIESFAHLGSGIHIAMQDLDIRGAGNLLGAEQSGFIADIGYEAYQKILAEAMRELKNENIRTSAQNTTNRNVPESLAWVDECQIESDLPLFFSDTYVPTSSERMLLYRELDNMNDDEQLNRYRERLTDRFGTPPREAEELLLVPKLKRLGLELGCDRLVLKHKRLKMCFTSNESSGFYDSTVLSRCIAFAMVNVNRTSMTEKDGHRVMTITSVATVSEAKDILQAILAQSPLTT